MIFKISALLDTCCLIQTSCIAKLPDSKVHGAKMRPTWVLSAPDGPHVGPMNLAIRDGNLYAWKYCLFIGAPLGYISRCRPRVGVWTDECLLSGTFLRKLCLICGWKASLHFKCCPQGPMTQTGQMDLRQSIQEWVQGWSWRTQNTTSTMLCTMCSWKSGKSWCWWVHLSHSRSLQSRQKCVPSRGLSVEQAAQAARRLSL